MFVSIEFFFSHLFNQTEQQQHKKKKYLHTISMKWKIRSINEMPMLFAIVFLYCLLFGIPFFLLFLFYIVPYGCVRICYVDGFVCLFRSGITAINSFLFVTSESKLVYRKYISIFVWYSDCR